MLVEFFTFLHFEKVRPSRCSKNLSYSVETERLSKGDGISRNSLPITVSGRNTKRSTSLAKRTSNVSCSPTKNTNESNDNLEESQNTSIKEKTLDLTPMEVRQASRQSKSAKKSASKLLRSAKKSEHEEANQTSTSTGAEVNEADNTEQTSTSAKKLSRSIRMQESQDTLVAISTPLQKDWSNNRKTVSSKKLSKSSRKSMLKLEESTTTKRNGSEVSFNFQEEFDKVSSCVTPEQTKQIQPVSIKKSHSKVRRSGKGLINVDEAFGTPLGLQEAEQNDFDTTPLQGEKSVNFSASVKKSNSKLRAS